MWLFALHIQLDILTPFPGRWHLHRGHLLHRKGGNSVLWMFSTLVEQKVGQGFEPQKEIG